MCHKRGERIDVGAWCWVLAIRSAYTAGSWLRLTDAHETDNVYKTDVQEEPWVSSVELSEDNQKVDYAPIYRVTSSFSAPSTPLPLHVDLLTVRQHRWYTANKRAMGSRGGNAEEMLVQEERECHT